MWNVYVFSDYTVFTRIITVATAYESHQNTQIKIFIWYEKANKTFFSIDMYIYKPLPHTDCLYHTFKKLLHKLELVDFQKCPYGIDCAILYGETHPVSTQYLTQLWL